MTGATNLLLIDERIIALTPALIRALDGKTNEAIVLQQLHWWMRHATAEHDGHVWVWNTYDDWAAMTGLTAKQARTAIQRLVERGIVVQHAPASRDRTLWYRIKYDHPLLTPSAQTGALQVPERADDSISTESTTERKDLSTSDSSSDGWSDEVKATTRTVAELIRAAGHALPTRGSKAADGWLREMDRLLRIGPPGDTGDDPPPTAAEVVAVARWALVESDFWPSNIRSVPTLRKQWTRLRAQQQRDRRTSSDGLADGYAAAAQALRERSSR